MPKDTTKDKVLFLKEQAKELKKEIRFLKKKLKDTQESRENWKVKAKLLGQSPSLGSLFDGDKAKHHSYSVILVTFCANIQSYGSMSLRSCFQVLICLQLALGTSRRTPSYSSIRIWVCKVGKYRVDYQDFSQDKWIYWIDESIHIGNEKILLVLGIAEKDVHFNKALSLSELRILHMSVSTQWKGEDISLILEDLKKKFPLSYIVSDEGTNLKKSYELSNSLHISDCTHALTKGLEKAYKKKELFKEFCGWAGSLRQKWYLKKDRQSWIPPNQRNKVRFANLFPLVKWAKKQLDNWQMLSEELQLELSFLKENEKWVINFWSIQEKLIKISLLLKIQGYSKANDLEVRAILDTSETEEEFVFSTTVLNYLKTLSEKIENKENIVCCSDVIESAFGKLKQKLSKSSAALTCFIFTLASIGGKYQTQEVKDALETIKQRDVMKRPLKPEKRTESMKKTVHFCPKK
jgi:hypothetical protein